MNRVYVQLLMLPALLSGFIVSGCVSSSRPEIFQPTASEAIVTRAPPPTLKVPPLATTEAISPNTPLPTSTIPQTIPVSTNPTTTPLQTSTSDLELQKNIWAIKALGLANEANALRTSNKPEAALKAYDFAIAAFDKALAIDASDKNIWCAKGLSLTWKAMVLSSLSRPDEANIVSAQAHEALEKGSPCGKVPE
jgi:hypothetical protein